jgi:hypothetical protein
VVLEQGTTPLLQGGVAEFALGCPSAEPPGAVWAAPTMQREQGTSPQAS